LTGRKIRGKAIFKVASILPAAGRQVSRNTRHVGRAGEIQWDLRLDQPQLGTLCIFPLSSTPLLTVFTAPPNVLIWYSVALILPVGVIPHTLIVMSEEVP
jgi:hypothetical protein